MVKYLTDFGGKSIETADFQRHFLEHFEAKELRLKKKRHFEHKRARAKQALTNWKKENIFSEEEEEEGPKTKAVGLEAVDPADWKAMLAAGGSASSEEESNQLRTPEEQCVFKGIPIPEPSEEELAEEEKPVLGLAQIDWDLWLTGEVGWIDWGGGRVDRLGEVGCGANRLGSLADGGGKVDRRGSRGEVGWIDGRRGSVGTLRRWR